MGHCKRMPFGKKKLRKLYGGWYHNGFVKPGTKMFKRKFSKRIRKNNDISNGNSYKKLWGWWEWS